MTEVVEPTKKGFFGKKKTDVVTSPIGNKKAVIDGIPTPSTVAHEDDDASVGSSVSGGGKTKKKPRAEYQKQIDSLKEEKKTIKKENETIKKNFELIKNWALSPPLKESTNKVLDFSAAVEEAQQEVEQDAAPTKSTARMFRKKPRAEYQAEIDTLLQETEALKTENNRIVAEIRAIKSWAKKCPL